MKLVDPALTTSHDLIAEIISAARQVFGTADYIPVSDCVDILLDCYNAAIRPDIKSTITELLSLFSTGNLRRTVEFMGVLDEIEVAIHFDPTIDLAEGPERFQ